MALGRSSLASSPRPAQRRRYLEPSKMELENDSEIVSRTPPQPNDNMPPQSRALITPILDTPPPTFHLKSDQMNFKCKTTTKCLLANAVEVVTKATHVDDTQIADGLVQIVDDLDRCRTFPWGRRSYHYLLIHVQKLNIAEKSANAFEKKKTTWACPGFILPLMKDVIEPVPRICQWKMNFKKKKAPTLEDVLQRVGDTKDIRSILIPTPREQETAYMRSFVPDDDESDAIID
ncbi:hypothetical protein TIFTF001_041520 [Ficus carica]|uniref:Uncharacterized protein n=1 Tax=Ficus carica TaxID=3494 RepID=A0AA87Z9J3_FICCA|nr:hypothetical protein TIFTF001_041520 [Ficus carica]